MASGWEKRGTRLVRNLHAERLAQRDLDQVEPDRVARRSAIWPPGIRAATSTTRTTPSSQTSSCGNAMPLRSPSACTALVATCSASQACRRRSWRGRRGSSRRRSRSRRPQPVGERERDHLAVAREHEAVELEALVVALDDRLAAGGLRQGGVEVDVDVVGLLEGRPRAARRSRPA